MKFALLGDDAGVLPVVRAIAAHPQHSLSHAAFVRESSASALLALHPSLRVVRRWEDVLSDGTADAVIVAGHGDELLEGAKKLAAEGRAVLLAPDVRQDSTFIYELALIRDDAPITLFPLLPLHVHPQVCKLAALIDDGQLGPILHLQLERELQTAEAGPPVFVPLQDVDQALLIDGDLLRLLGGNFDQVTALRSGVTSGRERSLESERPENSERAGRSVSVNDSAARERRVSTASVSLAGGGTPEATWSIRGTSEPTRWKLTVTGERGTAALVGGDVPGGVRLEIGGAEPAGQTTPADPTDDQLGELLLERFEAAVAGESVRPDWTDVTRAFEIVDASHRSIKRRRTIDLYFETPSERTIFKTQMTAAGCGVLTFTLLGLLVYLAVAGMFDVNEQVLHVARIVWLLPLIVFLGLQLLLFLTRPSSG